MLAEKELKAWELSESEVEMLRIPYKNKIGTFESINGKYKIEFKTDKPQGSAGLAHCFEFFVNGKRYVAPFNLAQKFMFELPEDYGYFIVYGLLQEYAKEKGLI